MSSMCESASAARGDVGELKTDIRSLRDRSDVRFDGVNAKFDAMNEKLDRLRDSLASAKIWALTLYIALAGTLFGTLARGFGWV